MFRKSFTAIIALAMATTLFAGCTANTTQTPNETTVATQATLSHLEIRSKLEEISGYEVEYDSTDNIYHVKVDSSSFVDDAIELALLYGDESSWNNIRDEAIYLSKELKSVVEGYGQDSSVRVHYTGSKGSLRTEDGEVISDTVNHIM